MTRGLNTQSNDALPRRPWGFPARLALDGVLSPAVEGDLFRLTEKGRLAVVYLSASRRPRNERSSPRAPLLRSLQPLAHFGARTLGRSHSAFGRHAGRRDSSNDQVFHEPRLLTGWNMPPATEAHTMQDKVTVQ